MELPCTSAESYARLYLKTSISLFSSYTETTRTTYQVPVPGIYGKQQFAAGAPIALLYEKSDAVSVGRTHTIVRLQTRIRRKMERIFRGVRICVGFPHRDFCVVVYMCSINFSLFFWISFPATTPRATTPVQMHSSKQATTSAGLPHPSYHAPNKLLGTG